MRILEADDPGVFFDWSDHSEETPIFADPRMDDGHELTKPRARRRRQGGKPGAMPSLHVD